MDAVQCATSEVDKCSPRYYNLFHASQGVFTYIKPTQNGETVSLYPDLDQNCTNLNNFAPTIQNAWEGGMQR